MATSISIKEHEAVPACGTYEVRFGDVRPSVYFHWYDLPSRRLRPELLTGADALELARAERDRLGR